MRYLTVVLIFTLPLLTQAQNSNCKCCTADYNAFDFWLGNWEVFNKNETIAGYNEITEIQNNCVIKENWKSATGKYTGTSNSFYNAKTDKWEQIWVDNQGGVLHLKGNKVENQMILYTDEEINEKGEKIKHRVTWTKNNDGTVRQYWEVITNDKDISVAFDGLYKKAK